MEKYCAVERREGEWPDACDEIVGDLKRHIEGAIEDVRQEWDDATGDADERYDEVQDRLHEYADSATPLYNADIWKCAEDNFRLVVIGGLDDPGIAEGIDEPLKLIQIRLYELISNALHEELQDIKDDMEEMESDAEWDEHWAEADKILESARRSQ